ncbi:hypothetical protein MUK42_37487 [Musa troglodytarum]|uniref:Uncharacterized protein n=1 Tax=Musa troglodytarum TaxID=320322 RepID=A0A9E7IDN4_9LILI|nr:hypothetical protein MUK42_37487 [Musa troglodytarum]
MDYCPTGSDQRHKLVSTAFPNSKSKQFLAWWGGKDDPSGEWRKKVASRLLTKEDEDYLQWQKRTLVASTTVLLRNSYIYKKLFRAVFVVLETVARVTSKKNETKVEKDVNLLCKILFRPCSFLLLLSLWNRC